MRGGNYVQKDGGLGFLGEDSEEGAHNTEEPHASET